MTVTPTDPLTRRQSELITQLRETEQRINDLIAKRTSIKAELDRIYPIARTLVEPPKGPGTVVSIWNYKSLGYTARIYTAQRGARALTDFDPTLNSTDFIVLALCLRETGADATKLLAVKELKDVPNVKRRLKLLIRESYIKIEFTKEATTP